MRKKVKSAEDLERLRNAIIESRKTRGLSITISSGTCGEARGSLEVVKAFKKEIQTHRLEDKIELKVTGCHGFCEVEPVVIIRRG